MRNRTVTRWSIVPYALTSFMPAVYQPAPHFPLASHLISMCIEPPDTDTCDGTAQLPGPEPYGPSYRAQCAGTPLESNWSLITLTQPSDGASVVVVPLVVVVALLVVVELLVVLSVVVELLALVELLVGELLMLDAKLVVVDDACTTSSGASLPDSRLANRSRESATMTTSTTVAPDTSGVMSTLVNARGSTGCAVATSAPGGGAVL
jgi:hypothetical protein